MVLKLLALRMKKICLVEDNDAIREVLEIILTSENYIVHSFSTVQQFNGRDQNIIPDLYLFDVMLPDGSGIDLCKEVKYGENDMKPVIIMSANAQINKIKEQCNPDDFISKPFDIDDVLDRIKKIINL